MSTIDSLMLSVALAMDCFTVSITCGIIHKRMGMQVLIMAFFFGAFQSLMPLIGWFAADFLSEEITAYDHWVAFGLLAVLGTRMIWNGMKGCDENCTFRPDNILTIITLAIATSIDALAVGFSFIGMGIRQTSDAIPTIAIIGAGSFLFTLLGKYIGVKVGKKFSWPAEQLGGFILLIIGVKVLLSHLLV